MGGTKFNIEEYLLELQLVKTRKKGYAKPRIPKSRFCRYSQDPVTDDLIWRSVVRGEASSAKRRQADYGSAQRAVKYTYSQSSTSSSRSSSAGPTSVEVSSRSLSVQAGPPLPTTSAGVIGWRSSVPDLRLERYSIR
ncbi:uncharacterized protein LOC122257600 [Penaeus japonicus]|uniref:uncharacterized protein LOC122257600 n=1 Tax=Penaeus japonicus TaxID=27405 RepID=UPI001C716B45|nr:uncharacterized protein LOC122257600 [Penaeus japonicus]